MKVTVIDTCCLINLYASQRPSIIIQAVFEKALIPMHVFGESLFIKQSTDDKPEQLVSVEIDFEELVECGVIEAVDFQGKELEQFIQLATLLDDGEAACMTVASSRVLLLATDDRKAIKVANDLNVEVLTTPEILMNWIDATSPKSEEIAKVIDNIERFGHFKPHHTSSHAEWWKNASS